MTNDNTDIANVILDIIDCGKRYIPELEELDPASTPIQELRMQLREVAFALINGKKVTPKDLS